MMEKSLREETEKLIRSWMQHDAAKLRDYLVASVEDPRVNVQSIFSRHFLIRAVIGEKFASLMEQEYRFAAAINWLARLAGGLSERAELEAAHFALQRGADNAEGIEVPHFLGQIFKSLPRAAEEMTVPNYVESFLLGTDFKEGSPKLDDASLGTFCGLWKEALAQEAAISERMRVLEPACGSANDYRFLETYGIARLIDYSGFDLCAKNVENARGLFPEARFNTGNAFEISEADEAYDFCFVHDLFEHLSLEGMAVAVKELCRVTRRGICVGFFNMDEITEHQELPMDDYHWNKLSMSGMKAEFAKHGFAGKAVHIGSFLRERTGCDYTHNPNAYTFILEKERALP